MAIESLREDGDVADGHEEIITEDEETLAKGEEWSYSKSGVNLEDADKTISEIWKLVSTTFKFRRSKPGQPLGIKGHYAGIIDVGAGERLIAVHTDNVGTKVLIAQLLDRYDTIGIDLVAMNVNDLVCIGAEPIALVDYLAVERYNADLTKEIVAGIVEGARKARVAIIGGETASVPDIIHGARPDSGFDLAGTCIGIVDRKSVITGEKMKPGDVVVGLASTGIHSNGLTLARKVLLGASKLTIHDKLPGTDVEIGEELLTPTRIYSQEALEIINKTEVRGLAHITGGAFTKLHRIGQYAKVGFRLDRMPRPHIIFEAIANLGRVSEEEMYRTFNMGIGFCIVTPRNQVEEICSIAEKHGSKAMVIGEAVKEGTIAIKTPRGAILKL